MPVSEARAGSVSTATMNAARSSLSAGSSALTAASSRLAAALRRRDRATAFAS